MKTNLSLIGLFKIEYEGDVFIGLNAKTYFCSGMKDKYSSKGVSHSTMLKIDDFRKVLNNNVIEPQVNKGFQLKQGRMYSYATKKEVRLKHFYAKRRILADGISTTYLNV